jgi:hypothetical protein
MESAARREATPERIQGRSSTPKRAWNLRCGVHLRAVNLRQSGLNLSSTMALKIAMIQHLAVLCAARD